MGTLMWEFQQALPFAKPARNGFDGKNIYLKIIIKIIYQSHVQLTHKSAVITGGGSGIGSHCVFIARQACCAYP